MSIMHISVAGHFTEVLVYDYKDVGDLPPSAQSSGKFVRAKLPSPGERGRRNHPRLTYDRFLQDLQNYEREIKIYWGNMQDIFDEEKDIINGETVHLSVIDCTIHFRDKLHPYVQWIVEFAGKLHEGENIYENLIESEVLEYPIHSTYILEPPLKVTEVVTTLKYQILKDGHFIEYHGETGEKLSPYEKLQFRL